MKLIKKKRIMAFALALALIFSLVPGVKSRADVRYTEVTVTLADQGTTAQEIEAVNVTLAAPIIGAAVEEKTVHDDEYDFDYNVYVPEPTVNVDANANYYVAGKFWISGYPSVVGEPEPFTGEFKADTYYYVEIGIYPKEGYVFADDVTLKVNGGTEYELNAYNYNEQLMFYTRVMAVAPAPTVYTVKFETGEGSKVDLQEIESGKTASKPSTNPTRTGYTFGGWYADEDWKTEFDFSKAITADTTVYAKWTAEEKKPTYTILDGANQTLETDAGKDLVARASGEVSKFTGLKIDDKEVDKSNYTITEGSTIAIIKAAFLDTLTEGEHTLTFVYTDGEVSTRFTIKKQATPTTVPSTPAEVTTPSTTEAAKKATATSPKTGDSLLVVPLGALMVISLIGILAMKKNKVK